MAIQGSVSTKLVSRLKWPIVEVLNLEKLRKFIALSLRRKKLLAQALLLAALLRLCLALFSMKKVVQWVERKHAPASSHHLEDIVWAVTAIGSRCFFATCLVNGLVARYLLNRSHIQSSLRIGVKKDEKGTLMAHAWVAVDNTVIIGKVSDLDSYTPLPFPGSKS